MAWKSLFNSKIQPCRCTLIILICTLATSTMLSLNGAFSASSTMPCTITSSKCSSALRKIAPIAGRRDCEPRLKKMNPLRQQIEHEIHERGPMRFSRYMDLCLYDPEFGYYSRNAEPLGKAGDFYTSSDVHAVFGRLLARQFEEMWRALGSPEKLEILELGPGRGLFAGDVLDWSEKEFPEFFQTLHYSLLERSPALRARLRETLARFLESGRLSLAAG